MKGSKSVYAPIAVCGIMGSGKNTVCEMMDSILRKMWIEPRTVAFADPIKQVVCEAFNLADDSEYDTFKRTTVTVDAFGTKVNGRDILRSYGMLMRSYDDTQFIKYVESEIVKYPNKITLISDLRFQNEIIWCHLNKIPIIKVVSEKSTSDGHVSEKGVPDEDCTFIIRNDGTLEELSKKVETVVKTIIEERRKNNEARYV